MRKDGSKVSERVVRRNGRRHAQMLQRVKRVHERASERGARQVRVKHEPCDEPTWAKASDVENWHRKRASSPIAESHWHARARLKEGDSQMTRLQVMRQRRERCVDDGQRWLGEVCGKRKSW